MKARLPAIEEDIFEANHVGGVLFKDSQSIHG
jgi:hypothetical protein